MKQIELTQGKVALVDDEDFEWLSQWKWSAYRSKNNTFYAVRSFWSKGKGNTVRMHRVIMNAQKGQMLDHVKHNGLDNQKTNLRFCTSSQNRTNSRKTRGNSKYKGVHWPSNKKKWRAQICFRSKMYHFGYFEDEVKAAKAYDKAAKKMFGKFACLNFPKEK